MQKIQTGHRLMLKSNNNSSPDSNGQNNKINNNREACSDDSPSNIYNRLTIRRRSYDQNLQNLSRVKQSGQFKKKRGSTSKGSPTLVKVCNQAKSGDATSRSVQASSVNFKPKTLRLGDIAALHREEKKQKQLIKTRHSPDAVKPQNQQSNSN